MSVYIINGFVFIAAVYLIYLSVSMKIKGVIPKSVIEPSVMEKCRDEKGFISYIFPWMIIFGVISLITSVTNFILVLNKILKWATNITACVFIIVFIMFAVMYKKGLDKYFDK